MEAAESQAAVRASVVLNAVTATLTLAGNLLALLTLGLSSQLRSPVRLLMANLALSDLLIGAAVLPYAIHRAAQVGSTEPAGGDGGGQGRDSHPDPVCRGMGFLRTLLLSGSSFTLVAMSYERYVAIAYPLKHLYMITLQKAALYVLLVWLSALAVSLLPFVGLGGYHRLSPHQFLCWPEGPAFSLLFLVGVFGGTFSAMALMYVRILRAVRRHRSLIHALVLRIAQGFTGHKVERFRATSTISLVLGVYLLTWSPFCLAQVVQSLADAPTLPDTLRVVTPCLLYANSACNPWIYCALNAKCRCTLRKKAGQLWRATCRVCTLTFPDVRVFDTSIVMAMHNRHQRSRVQIINVKPLPMSNFQS